MVWHKTRQQEIRDRAGYPGHREALYGLARDTQHGVEKLVDVALGEREQGAFKGPRKCLLYLQLGGGGSQKQPGRRGGFKTKPAVGMEFQGQD